MSVVENGSGATTEPMDAQVSTGAPADAAAAAPASNPAPAEPAPSSSAAGETKADLLSVARDVVKKDAAAAPPAAKVDEGGTDPAAPGEPEAPRDPDDYSDVPFNKHPRFQQVIREKNDLRGQVATMAPKVEQFDQIQGFLRQNALTSDEAADALVVAGLMKIDPVEAWRHLVPVIQKVGLAAGEILSPELQQQVASGKYTEEQALEISRAHAARNCAAARGHFQQNLMRQDRETELGDARVSAVNQWEQDIAKRDPDYASHKKVLVDKWVRAEMANAQLAGKTPRTPQEALALVEKVYGEVNSYLRKAMPAKRAVAPTPTNAAVAGTPTAKPKSLREAAELAVRR